MSNWYENERFWEQTYPFMFPEARFAGTEAEITGILGLVGEPVQQALDLCCGPGRASVELARRGVRVTGVDRSSFMLDRARERAKVNDVEVDWILSDMREFEAPAQYDLALSLFTSFGYFEDEEDNARVLRRVRESLRPGGCFVLDTVSKERLAAIFSPASCSQTEDGRVLFEKRRIFRDWQQIESTWYVLEAGHYDAFTIRHWLYSGSELRRMLLAAGFRSVALYGSYAGAPFTGDARLHLVARA